MINEWLDIFKLGWVTKNVEKVMDLFTDDVEYWENPHHKLQGKDIIENEWNAIFKQDNVVLGLEIFSSINEKHTVLWNLQYVDDKAEMQSWAGTYLIKLDQTGKCNYFHQTGEKR